MRRISRSRKCKCLWNHIASKNIVWNKQHPPRLVTKEEAEQIIKDGDKEARQFYADKGWEYPPPCLM